MPVNQEELAICRRRGHLNNHSLNRALWSQCRWCGIWLREVQTTEERETEPPEDEQDLIAKRYKDKH